MKPYDHRNCTVRRDGSVVLKSTGQVIGTLKRERIGTEKAGHALWHVVSGALNATYSTRKSAVSWLLECRSMEAFSKRLTPEARS